MRARWLLPVLGLTLLAGAATFERQERLNPMVDLLEQKQPAFGVYAPANRRARDGGTAPPQKSPAELAQEAVAYDRADFLFDGGMEGDFERGFASFEAFVKALGQADAAENGSPRLRQPLAVKTPEIAPDPALAAERIAKQLDLGTSVIVFVGVESAEEVRTGLAAMRFRSQGGTRPDRVGSAPAFWGVSEAEYRERADLWPLNPRGELVNWTIVESRKGLDNVREIAAVPGIGVLFPGAGTLRGLFTTTDANGERVFDEAGWEAAIQQVLAACKEFNVACGYPASVNDIEMRMKQGFSVFIMGWGAPGFAAVDLGRKLANR